MSTHAKTSSMIKKELKQAFANVTFSVRSDIFAGGTSVRIEWTNGPATEWVLKIVSKYQYGHFDCRQDLYEISNNRSDIPQVKYVQVRREVSEDIKDFENISSIDEPALIF